MSDHGIAFSWDSKNLLTQIIVCQENTKEGFIELCDQLFVKNIKDYIELCFYFFHTKENAIDYIYMKNIDDIEEETALVKSECKAHLLKEKFTVRLSPPKVIKIYKNPK